MLAAPSAVNSAAVTAYMSIRGLKLSVKRGAIWTSSGGCQEGPEVVYTDGDAGQGDREDSQANCLVGGLMRLPLDAAARHHFV